VAGHNSNEYLAGSRGYESKSFVFIGIQTTISREVMLWTSQTALRDCYILLMQSRKERNGSVTGPVFKDLLEREKLNRKPAKSNVSEQPSAPADLYQDAGGGYNLDFTFPQE
jgi:hypothetical protein